MLLAAIGDRLWSSRRKSVISTGQLEMIAVHVEAPGGVRRQSGIVIRLFD
jgi:hypothetical protein